MKLQTSLHFVLLLERKAAMGAVLFRHNQEAYESALALLAKTGKAAVIHPTGTGKSFIGFKLCEDNPNKTGRQQEKTLETPRITFTSIHMQGLC